MCSIAHSLEESIGIHAVSKIEQRKAKFPKWMEQPSYDTFLMSGHKQTFLMGLLQDPTAEHDKKDIVSLLSIKSNDICSQNLGTGC